MATKIRTLEYCIASPPQRALGIKIVELSQRIFKANAPRHIASLWGDPDHKQALHPHATWIQGAVPLGKVDDLAKEVAALQQKFPRFHLRANGFLIKEENLHELSIALGYDTTPQLHEAQRRIIRCAIACGATAIPVERDPAGYDPRQRCGENSPTGRALAHSFYGEDGTLDPDRFVVHDTTNWLARTNNPPRLPRISKVEIGEQFSGVHGPPTLYALGPHGQCVQRLS